MHHYNLKEREKMNERRFPTWIASSLALIGLLIGVTQLSAQIPEEFSYQGILTDPTGTPISNGNHAIRVSLYTNPTGGSAIHTEEQSLMVEDGLFSMIVGATPFSASVDFSQQYWLGISVDGGPELTPRTALVAVPYAMNAKSAEEAESLAPTATGVVRQVNGLDGNVTIVGGGGTTVSKSGSTLTISSTGGSATGIEGVQSSDGSIAVTNPNGPVANLSIPNGSIGTEKLSAGGSSAGQVLTSTGSGLSWETPASGLTLPYSGSHGGTGAGIEVTTTFKSAALQGKTTHLGSGISGVSTGPGQAGTFTIQNGSNTTAAVWAQTNGTGPAVKAKYTGGESDGTALELENGFIKVSGAKPHSFCAQNKRREHFGPHHDALLPGSLFI